MTVFKDCLLGLFFCFLANSNQLGFFRNQFSCCFCFFIPLFLVICFLFFYLKNVVNLIADLNENSRIHFPFFFS